MKKQLFILLFLFSACKALFARTGSVSDDYIILLGPLLVVVLILIIMKVKAHFTKEKAEDSLE